MFSKIQVRHDEQNPPNQPMIEMSQDCPVEWDESNNVDLRQLAKSPRFATPGSSASTPTREGPTGLLDDIKRRLERSSNDDSSPASLHTQPSSACRKQKRKGRRKSEDEIDGIFSILKDEAHKGKLSPAAAATQKTSNFSSMPPPKPIVSGLASRFKRRRRVTIESEATRKRRGPMEKTDAESFAGQAPFPEHTNVDSDFDALLKQVTSAEPSKSPRRPLRPIDENILPGSNSRSENQTKRKAPKSTTIASKEQRKDADWRIIPGSSHAPTSVSVTNAPLLPQRATDQRTSVQTRDGSKQQTLVARQVSIPSAPSSSNEDDDEFGDFDFDEDAMANLDMLLSIKSSQQPLPTQLSQSMKGAPKPVFPYEINTTSAGLQPTSTAIRTMQTSTLQKFAQESKPATQTKRSPPMAEPKPLQDLALPTREPQPVVQRPESNQTSKGHLPQASVAQAPNRQTQQGALGPGSQTALARPRRPNSTAGVETKQSVSSYSEQPGSSDIEDFGDFPNINFAEVDKAIETRLTELSQQSAPVHMHATGRQNLGPLTFSRDAIVKNPKIPNQTQNLNFATFSRYMVIEVHVDHATFTKRLAVATWKESMVADEEKGRDFHRNVDVSKQKTAEQVTEDSTFRRNTCYNTDGYLHLRGEWYYTIIAAGDIIHVCSLSGQYRTDPEALPIILHSCPPPGSDADDLVLIIHPDVLMTPTTVSEAVGCSRRAVLKSRIGSTGLSSKAALVGTMRHSLFETCMQEHNFDSAYLNRKVKKIVRKNADSLLSCNISTEEAEAELLAVIPTIRKFISDHTSFGRGSKNVGMSSMKPLEGRSGEAEVQVMARSTHSVEEPLISHELGLKGNVDVVLETTSQTLGRTASAPSGTMNSLMGLELKTGHNQTTQESHRAQLALYILLLQISYGVNPDNRGQWNPQTIGSPIGASASAMLLYLNQQSSRVVHVSLLLNEIKSLIEQRNIATTGVVEASRPRGVVLLYDDENKENDKELKRIHLSPAPPAKLPQVKANSHMCTKCYVNRECMLYAATEADPAGPNWNTRTSHKEIFDRFTGHLRSDDIIFFREWDRLIDLEAEASSSSVALAWVTKSWLREEEKGETISRLEYDGPEPAGEGRAVIVFKRNALVPSPIPTPLDNLSFTRGDRVVVGTDSTSFGGADQTTDSGNRISTKATKFRHRMHIVRGTVESIQRDKILISGGREDLERIRDMVQRYRRESFDASNSKLLFRIDKDKASIGIGTLRQNLINFMTADSPSMGGEPDSPTRMLKRSILPRLRDVVVRLKPPEFLKQGRGFLFENREWQIPGCEMDRLAMEFNKLNSDQQNAVEKAINANDFAIIQGLPGTGKTSTLAFITRLLAAHGKRVLVTSYTHSAVDNVVLKLVENGMKTPLGATSPLVRIAKKSSCHEAVHQLLVSEIANRLETIHLSQDSSQYNNGLLSYSSQNEINQMSASTESLKKVVSEARVVCCTALSIPRSPLLMGQEFDVVIVDEAGQISQPAILGALMSAKSFLLVGDHLQLPPLVVSEVAQSGGFGVSLLSRLAENHPTAVAPLTYQYRMNADICRLSSHVVYGGRLRCGTPEVSSQILKLPRFPHRLPVKATPSCYGWLNGVIDPKRPAIFVDTDNIRKEPRPISQLGKRIDKDAFEPQETKAGGKRGGNVLNPTEASLVRYIAVALTSSGLDPASIGVISPYRAQIELIEENATMASLKLQGLELSTIDRYQGRDKPAIILSLVRSNSGGKAGRLLQDIRRLNVAMTRAKRKLFVIGSFSTLNSGSEPLQRMLQDMEKQGFRLILPENALKCYTIP